jgi:hypothetical protein
MEEEKSEAVRREIAVPSAPPAPSAVPERKKLPLEQCAAIAASIARRKADAAKILKENGLDRAQWDEAEQHWANEIRKETGRGKSTLLRAYDAAYVGRLEDERGPIRVEEYARLVIAAERGNADEVLSELGLPRGARLRIERVYLRKIAEDSGFGEKVRRAIDGARDE